MATTNTIAYNGLTIGSGTVYGIVEFEGMDSLQLSAGAVDVVRVDGGFPLTQNASPRTLRIAVRVPDSGLAAFKAAYTRTALESDMDVVWDDMPAQTVVCKLSSRQHVRTRDSEFGARRLYVVEMVSSAGVIVGTTQRSLALTQNVNSAALTQSGDTDAYPVFIMTGVDGLTDTPITFVNVTKSQTLTLSAADVIAMAVGDTLTVDMNPLKRSVIENDGTDTSVYSEVTAASEFWAISASDIIKFTATFTITAPTCTAYWYDTYL